MRIAVLVPSAAYLGNAGSRIRYGRIAGPLEQQGVSIDMVDIGQFDPGSASHDVTIISKCHDARSLLIAAVLARRGHLVGVDLFDDYFSQLSDSRLVRFRRWLEQLAPWLSFALCSTPGMAVIASGYRADLPVLQLNDPAPAGWDRDFEDRIERQLAEALDQRIIRICWFGIGDNPYFAVGLHDVRSFADQLAELARRTDASIELSLLTNVRALDAERLAMIQSLPVRVAVEEWTEEREAALLARSFACFLPVGGQSFSVAKSLNRGVTALTAGCQLLSSGFPLYAPFDEFIYRDAGVFADDYRSGRMKLSAARSDRLHQLIAQWASAGREAEAMAAFLKSLQPDHRSAPNLLVLVHGVATNGVAHKIVQAHGGLSVATPVSATKLGYDVIFGGSDDLALQMYVAKRQIDRLTAAARSRLRPVTEIDGKPFALLPPVEVPGPGTAADWKRASLPFQMASYAPAFERMHDCLEEAFGPLTMIVSENSALPFDASPEERAA